MRKNGPAYKSGLRDLDVITHVHGVPAQRAGEFVTHVKEHFEEGIPVTVMRGSRGAVVELILKPEIIMPRHYRPS